MLSRDTKQACLWIVKGNERRRRICPQSRYVIEIDGAVNDIGIDLPPDMQARLRKAIIINCYDGHKYPFERLAINDFLSRSDFYRRKEIFLANVAERLDLQ